VKAKRVQVVLDHPEGVALQFVARHESGAGQPLDSKSGAFGPSPVESLLGSLGGCAGMDVIATLRKKRQTVTAYEVVVEGQRREEHPRVFTRIEVVHRLRGTGISRAAVEEAIRLSDAKYCTVHAMLGGVAEIVSRYEIESDP